MEYIYSALLLHSVGQQVNEGNVKKVLENVGAKVDDVKIKALVSALEGVNIDEVVKQAAMPIAAPVAKEEKDEVKEKPKEEDEAKRAEEAVGGLASLFG